MQTDVELCYSYFHTDLLGQTLKKILQAYHHRTRYVHTGPALVCVNYSFAVQSYFETSMFLFQLFLVLPTVIILKYRSTERGRDEEIG